MPGIFINDGGATSSALGTALGQLATNLGPEAAAKAQLLREQTEEADRQNSLLSNTQQGALAIPGVLSAPGINADPTATPTVAGTLAGTAVPPAAPQPSTAFGARDQTAGFSPFARVLAGSYSKDPSMANVTAGINLGRQGVGGPGTDFATQADIVRAQSTPQHIGMGDTLLINPSKGDAPGNVVHGSSTYTGAGEEAGAHSDNDLAAKDSVLGATATGNLGTAQSLESLYNDAVAAGNANPVDVAGTQLGRRISAALGIDVDKIAGGMDGVKAEIANRYQAMFGNLRDNQGQPLVRGGGPGVTAQFPDADSNPDTFHRMSASLKATLAHQIADGLAADAYLHNRRTMGPDAGDLYRQQREANAAAEAKAQSAIGPGPAGGSGGSGFVDVPDQATGEKLPKGTKFKYPGGNPHGYMSQGPS